MSNLRLFNNTPLACYSLRLIYPRLSGDDERLQTIVIPAKAGI